MTRLSIIQRFFDGLIFGLFSLIPGLSGSQYLINRNRLGYYTDETAFLFSKNPNQAGLNARFKAILISFWKNIPFLAGIILSLVGFTMIFILIIQRWFSFWFIVFSFSISYILLKITPFIEKRKIDFWNQNVKPKYHNGAYFAVAFLSFLLILIASFVFNPQASESLNGSIGNSIKVFFLSLIIASFAFIPGFSIILLFGLFGIYPSFFLAITYLHTGLIISFMFGILLGLTISAKIATVVRKKWPDLLNFISLGAMVGAFFGLFISYFTIQSPDPYWYRLVIMPIAVGLLILVDYLAYYLKTRNRTYLSSKFIVYKKAFTGRSETEIRQMKNNRLNKANDKVYLLIIDGYAKSKKEEGDATKLANTPFLNSIFNNEKSILLNACGLEVGLPKGQMGNSEVGHMNIGAGRIVRQGLVRINHDIENKAFFKNDKFLTAIKEAKTNNSNLHIIGLVSDGGVHSHIDHLLALLELCKQENFTKKVYVHAFTDGRDTDPNGGVEFVGKVYEKIKEIGANLASISGRYYGMDRDKRWEKTYKAFNAMFLSKGSSFDDPIKFLKDSYDKGLTDEFIIPGFNSKVKTELGKKDSIIIINFRDDRVRQISHLLKGSNLYEEDQYDSTNENYFVSMMNYDGIESNAAFAKQIIKNSIGDVLSKKRIPQLRAAETEKYPHVTFFLDGGVDKEHFVKEKLMVNSPKVATYDLQPEMSIFLLTDKLLNKISNFRTGFINFANPDMVGHTGSIEATVKALEAVDICARQLKELIVDKLNGTLIVTSDHGNSDEMILDNGRISTKHSKNPVPFVIIKKDGFVDVKSKFKDSENILGKLSNIAPTILKMLEIDKPSEMNEESLI